MILDVPVINEDGSVKFMTHLDAEQTQVLLQFALAYLLHSGLVKVSGKEVDLAQMELPFSD